MTGRGPRRPPRGELLDKELRFHLDQHAADLEARGVDPAEARRIARLELGGLDQVKEGVRDVRRTRWLEDLWQDVRYALRALARRRAFAAVVVCTLALGTGAATVMFTVINGVLLEPLPFPAPDRLLSVQEQTDWSNAYGNRWAFAYPNFLDCRREARALALAAWRYAGGTISGAADPEYVDGYQVSANLFTVVGVPMAHGRRFDDADDRPGAAAVAIISDSLWRRRFDADPRAIGRTFVFDGQPYTIAGVLPAGFRLAGDADVYTPLGRSPTPRLLNRELHPGISVWARLAPGATAAEAQSELALIGSRLARQYPASNNGRTFVAEPLHPDVGDVGTTLWLLLAAVGLVLLIACANVASLLLARAVSRDRELAVRAALGAGRGRLMRQCLTESAVLGLLGGGAGIALAALGVRPFVAGWPGALPRADQVRLDGHVLAFALVVGLATGLIFGAAPALRVPSRRLEEALRSGARTVAGGARRLHGGFVAAEIAMAIVLLVSAASLARTVLRLSSADPGVDVSNVLVTRMALSPAVLASPARTRAAWDDVLARAQQAGGVAAVALVDTVPMREGNNQLPYWPTPSPPPPSEQPLALATSVTPGYLEAMGLRLRRGRFFTSDDRAGSRPVVVVDEVLAQHAFGREDPVGRSLWIRDMGPGPLEIVGVVGHVRHWGLASDERAVVRAQFYYPFAQVPDPLVRRWSELMSLVVRTRVPPLSLVGALRHELRGASGDQVLYEVQTMEQLAQSTLARQRFLLLLFGVFAALALGLACLGVYGVLAYLTSQRVPEIGMRMALGADAARVMRLVLGQSVELIAAGAAAGTLAALAAGRVLQRFVDGVQAPGAPIIVGTLAVLVAAAAIASFVPAFRATRIDAISALRQD
ncbi:MAG TPA: ABC transporter permease [Vicinamibacterales bacterium]|nr:ABC transporter permease [Vicinamibacterales bacterium]